MNNLFTTLFMAIRARIMPVWIRLRRWFSWSFIQAQFLIKIRDFFTALTDVRPRHKRDYYSFFRWLVSKRLAFAVTVVMGMVAVVYITIMLPEGVLGGGGVRAYKYRSIPLKFCSGQVQILARDGHVAYEGRVDKGAAVGQGRLYAEDGALVYEGEFDKSMYNGEGTLYYAGGNPRYEGTFVDNVFSGTGIYYRPNGVMEYQGSFVSGERTGIGTLYNSVGKAVFQGSFLNGGILYQDFLDRTTQSVSDLYSGQTEVYQSDSEYCVYMSEIDAVYAVEDGSQTLENEWTVKRVYVLRDAIDLASGECTNIRHLIAALGDPLYYGTVWVDMPEAVAWNQLAHNRPDQLIRVDMDLQASFSNVFDVSGYDRDHQLYLYTFERDGLLYNFYFTQAGESEFVMYSIELA